VIVLCTDFRVAIMGAHSSDDQLRAGDNPLRCKQYEPSGSK